MIPRGKTAIYGLIDPKTRECFYIGQTINPIQRQAAHNFIGGKGNGLDFLVFVYCDHENASYIETMLIKEFKSIGQAKLNIHKSAKTNYGKSNCGRIKWKEGGIIFRSHHEAAQFFRCSNGTIANAINKYNGKLSNFDRGVTLIDMNTKD